MGPLYLTRRAYTDWGTFGELDYDGIIVAYTVEKQWADNKRRISCIPNGKYICRPRFFNRGGYAAIEICDVPNRSHILFHIGNFERDIVGCIALGDSIGILKNQLAVLNSKKTFDAFMDRFGKGQFTVIIQNTKEGFLDA